MCSTLHCEPEQWLRLGCALHFSLSFLNTESWVNKVVYQESSHSLPFNINTAYNIILTYSEFLRSKKRLDVGQPSKLEVIIMGK